MGKGGGGQGAQAWLGNYKVALTEEAELAPEERVVETEGIGQKGTGREMVGGGRSAF